MRIARATVSGSATGAPCTSGAAPAVIGCEPDLGAVEEIVFAD
jgi:hypothetical protein